MLDEFDLKLIKALRENGRATYVDLAKGLGVVEGTVRKRVNELLRSGIIRVSAIPDLRTMGYNFISLIGLQIKMSELKKVSHVLAGKPNICYLAFVTGRYDLLAIVASRSTDELARVIETDIAMVPGILRSETFINLDIVKGGLLEFDISGIIDSFSGNLPPRSSSNKENREL